MTSEHLYLPDPERGRNCSDVFVKVTSAECSIVDAKRLLMNPGAGPLQLRRVGRDAPTVVYQVVDRPHILVGKSRPADPVADRGEIARILGEACVLID
jgi:hypothetical protein